MRQKLFSAKRKAEQLVKDQETCTIKLQRAEQLLAGLGNEAERWAAASAILERAMGYLIGNIMLAAGFIAYIGPYTSEFREELIDYWRNKAKEIDILADPEWKCADVLVDPAEVRARMAALFAEIGWVAGMSAMMFVILKMAGILRISAEMEEAGMDVSKHGGPAYDMAGKAGPQA